MKRLSSILLGACLMISFFSGCKKDEPESETVDLKAPVIAALAEGNAVIVSWQTVTSATGYKVEYKKADAAEFAVAGSASYSPYRVTGLEYGNTYEFRVKATCGEAESPYSNVVSVGVFNLLPKTTVSLRAGITFIDVEWEPVEGATSYQVQHKITASSDYTDDFTVAAADIAELHRIANLQSGVSYDVRVGAIAEGYSMSYSDPATIATTEAPATLISDGAQLVSWLGSINSGYTDVAALAGDIDMQGLTITPASGFAGTLEGQGFAIKNLVSSVPLFAENSGVIKNLILDESCVFTPSTPEFGALVAVDNGGSYISVSTAASVTYTATANIEENLVIGGLVGVSNSEAVSSFNTCSNSGTITLDATNYSHWSVAMGGIIGYTRQSKFEACTNSGKISLFAQYGDPFHNWSYVEGFTTDPDGNICVGGIVGKAWDIRDTDYESTFSKCENLQGGEITVKHSAINALANSDADYGCINVAGICGQGNGTMESCHNRAPITVSAVSSNNSHPERQNCLVHVGGLVGKTYIGLAITSCSNRAPINVTYDGSWEKKARYMSAVGGICGGHAYGSSTGKMYYCANHGPITVTGNGSLTVGGIVGAQGYQRGNKVYNTATIDVYVRKAYVGGLLGFADGGVSQQFIKSSWCEADITARTIETSRYNLATGGLVGFYQIGQCDGSLIGVDGEGPCRYSGNISTPGQFKTGMAIGWLNIDGKTQVYGSEAYPIQLSGTLEREELEKTTITPENVFSGEHYNGDNYAATGNLAIGVIKGTVDVTIYVQCAGASE